MKLTEAIEIYLRSMRSEMTARNYKIYLTKLYGYLGDIDITKIKIVDITKFEHYHNTISTKKQTENALMCLRSFFKYFRMRYELDVLDHTKITVDKQPRNHWKNLSPEQLQKLYNHFDKTKINEMRNLCICKVLYCTGLRDFELRQLTKSKIDWNRKRALIIGKGGEPETVFFTKECLDLLKRYIDMRQDSHDALFIDHRRDSGKPISGSLIRTYMTRWSSELGFKVHAHMLRKTACTDLYLKSGDIYGVKNFARHKNVTTTENYAIVPEEHNQAFHNRYMGDSHDFCFAQKESGNLAYEIKGFCSDLKKLKKLKKAIKLAVDEILS